MTGRHEVGQHRAPARPRRRVGPFLTVAAAAVAAVAIPALAVPPLPVIPDPPRPVLAADRPTPVASQPPVATGVLAGARVDVAGQPTLSTTREDLWTVRPHMTRARPGWSGARSASGTAAGSTGGAESTGTLPGPAVPAATGKVTDPALTPLPTEPPPAPVATPTPEPSATPTPTPEPTPTVTPLPVPPEPTPEPCTRGQSGKPCHAAHATATETP